MLLYVMYNKRNPIATLAPMLYNLFKCFHHATGNSEDEQLSGISLSDHLALESLRHSGFLLRRLLPGWEVLERLRDWAVLELVRAGRIAWVRRGWWEVLELVRDGKVPE